MVHFQACSHVRNSATSEDTEYVAKLVAELCGFLFHRVALMWQVFRTVAQQGMAEFVKKGCTTLVAVDARWIVGQNVAVGIPRKTR